MAIDSLIIPHEYTITLNNPLFLLYDGKNNKN